jgi:serine protease SohB
MEFLAHYGLFTLKTFTLVIAILVLVAGIFAIGRKPRTKLEITALNKNYEKTKQLLQKEINGKAEKIKKSKKTKPSLFVIDFQGDIKASQAEQLREEVTAILSIAQPKDEIVVRIESPGGAVNGYGLAAAQLHRIREKGIHLTACIDKMAASGGYLMACVADRILAAPFAIIGSIGVVAQIPNFHRWLKKNDIDVELLTAGEYKRTLTLLGENTEKGRKKFQEDLELIHSTFKQYVLTNRPDLNIEEVATGEHWLAKDAHALKLVDEIRTSDDFLVNKMAEYNLFRIKAQSKPSIIDKILKPGMKFMHPWF